MKIMIAFDAEEYPEIRHKTLEQIFSDTQRVYEVRGTDKDQVAAILQDGKEAPKAS